MKKINIALLIMMMPCLLIQAAQERKSDNDSDTESVQIFKRRRLHSDSDEQAIGAILGVPAAPSVDEDRQNLINSAVQNYPALDEGLILLRRQGKKIPKLADYLEANLVCDDQDEDADVNQNKKDFGAIIEELEQNIARGMKSKFLEHVDNLILTDVSESDSDSNTNSDSDTDEESTGNEILSDKYIGQDKELKYIQKYQDGFMKPIVREWINSKNDVEITPLFKSVQNNNVPIFKVLMKLGADPNIQDEDGRTPLHETVSLPDIEMMTILFQAGANLDIQDNYGKTAMYEACMYDDMEMVKLLYRWGANPIIIDDNGIFYNQDSMTEIREDYCNRYFDDLSAAYLKDWELRKAIVDGDMHQVKSLIEQGAHADFLPSQAYIRTVLNRRNAHIHDHTQIYSNNSDSNLAIAISFNDDIEIIRMLLQAGARPNKRSNCTREAALHYAVEALNPEYVKILIEYGADVNLKEDGNGYTALSLALQDYEDAPAVKKEIMQLLLQAGTVESLNIIHTDLESPLMTVVENNNVELLRMFLEYSPDVNFIDSGNTNDGDSLLHTASRHNHIEVARLLLAHQADRTILNDDDQTAIDVATTDEMRALLS